MKRLVFLFFVLMTALPVSAQYMPAEGILSKKGTKVFAEGRKLTKGEISATLSMFSDDKGVGYDIRWKRARRTYNAGIALTTLGSVGVVAGGMAFSYGFVSLIVAGIATPFYAVADDMSALDIHLAGAAGAVYAGTGVMIAGAAMLCAGIPMICVFNGRMKRIIRNYNGQYSQGASDAVTLNFGPTRNGFGLALNF